MLTQGFNIAVIDYDDVLTGYSCQNFCSLCLLLLVQYGQLQAAAVCFNQLKWYFRSMNMAGSQSWSQISYNYIIIMYFY